jgi:hypothetical protein
MAAALPLPIGFGDVEDVTFPLAAEDREKIFTMTGAELDALVAKERGNARLLLVGMLGAGLLVGLALPKRR